MRAHIDNAYLHDEGISISEKVLKKHRADVFELSRLLALDSRLPLEGGIRKDAEAFLRDFEEYAQKETNRKRRASLIDALELLRKVYLWISSSYRKTMSSRSCLHDFILAPAYLKIWSSQIAAKGINRHLDGILRNVYQVEKEAAQ